MTNAVTISAPATGAVGQGLAITGTVVPATDTVSVILSQQNTTLPAGPYEFATTANGGTYAGVLEPVAAGTWYAWAWDQATGLSAVSGAITVPNAGLPLVPSVPINLSVVASLLGGTAAGETPDELAQAAAVASTDTAIVAQSGKVLFQQPFSAIWTWITGLLPTYLRPQVTVTANVNITNSAHSGRTLVVTASGITLTALIPSLGAGFTCDVINASGSPVTLAGMTTTTGGTSIPAGGIARLFGVSVAGTVTLWAELDGASGFAALPTTKPTASGVLWNNNGVVSVTS
jgi:hypothetical protein